MSSAGLKRSSSGSRHVRSGSQGKPLDSRVFGAFVGEGALGQADRLDLEGSGVGVTVPDDLLDEVLPAGVFHPREGDVWREVVSLLIETQFDHPGFDGLVEAGHLLAAASDPEPDDADVLQRREDAEPAELRAEGVDAGGIDGLVQRVGDRVDAVFGRVTEKLQRDVGLLGIGDVQAARALEQLLDGRHLGCEPVEIDTDEQSLAHVGRSATTLINVADATTGRDVALNPLAREAIHMTEDPRDPEDHQFSEGQGFSEPYEPFDLDPPELDVDPSTVDPVDSHVVTDLLDSRNLAADAVDADELLDVGLSYMGINRHEQAADTFERAARFADEEELEQEAWVNKGVAHAELEEYDAAIGAYREAIEIDDGSEHAAVAETNLAYALWEFGRTEEAMEHAERAVEINPRSGQAWYNRGFFLNERGLSEDAVNCFDNAVRLGFRNADLLEEKAVALEEMGEDERAEEVAEEAEQMRKEREENLVE